jgi:pyruvate/2-oxoglutarate dehydrogenase complex dihydrolipoamide dehydrogenase (E3) component
MGAEQFDVAVIGGGSGGYAAARTTAAAGLRTAVIDGADELGGLCILRGCMPTKALLHAADVMHTVQRSGTWGVKAGDPGFDFVAVMARKDAMIQDFADYRRQQLEDGRFELIRAMARFRDPHTLDLSNGETIQARNFVIATGSTLGPCPLPELQALDCLSSDSALKLKRLPKSMIVLGGGAVAVEFAQFFARFGARVTMIQRSPHILHGFDTDAAEVVETVLRREGIELRAGTRLVGARVIEGQKEVTFEHGGVLLSARADEVFYALGRVPNVAGLNLDAAGVKLENARIVTDGQMRTSAPHIFASGDCTGLHEIVHVAIQQGETAARNIAMPEAPREMDYRLLIEVVFSDPQIAQVGLNEKRARASNTPFLVAQYPFNDHGKSLIMEAKDGFVKLLAKPMDGEILGGCCVGPMGGELIHEIVAAMHKRMTVRELAEMPHYHPTLAEIWTYPAEEIMEQFAKYRISLTASLSRVASGS